MSKYSNEFKLEVVKYCIEGHHGFNQLLIILIYQLK